MGTGEEEALEKFNKFGEKSVDRGLGGGWA